MKKNRFHSIILIFICLCLFTQNRAQTVFRYKATVDTVMRDGFYQINLQPELAAGLQNSMTDIRLLDATGKQVPYILKSDLPAFKESKFMALPILSNKKEADNQVHVIIENASKRLLNELMLVIKNTAANRMVTLAGSDDNQNWYVVKENIYLANFFSATADTFMQALVFPASNYRYFKIIFAGKNALPVNIVKAGVYEETFINGKYLPLPRPTLLQKDSNDKFSYVFIQFNNHYFIDRLELQAKGSKFYKRILEVYTGTVEHPVLLDNFILSPATPPVYMVPVKTNHLLLKIRNDDNPPLQITGVTAFQLNRYLLAYLEKGSSHQLVWGDSAAVAPSYDLEAFKDSIGNNATVIGYGSIQKNTLPVQQAPATGNSKLWLWLSIAAACLVLLALTFKLTREINKRNT
jgi:hypothetical protein